MIQQFNQVIKPENLSIYGLPKMEQVNSMRHIQLEWTAHFYFGKQYFEIVQLQAVILLGYVEWTDKYDMEHEFDLSTLDLSDWSVTFNCNSQLFSFDKISIDIERKEMVVS